MGESAQPDIVQQLIDNTTEIIAASSDGSPEKLSALANRQKTLTRMLQKSVSADAPGYSRASMNTLQDLLAKAADGVRVQMGHYRGIMQANGTKRKVLRAYGTVTVADNSTR